MLCLPHSQYIYRRPGFECVVKQWQMALYMSDSDSNDCKLPSEQGTPPTLARKVWSVRLHEEEIVKRITKTLAPKSCASVVDIL